MTRYFVDVAGKYLGGFDGADALVRVPAGAIEAPSAPADARQTWTGATWGPVPPPPTAADLAESEIGRSKAFDALVDVLVERFPAVFPARGNLIAAIRAKAK